MADLEVVVRLLAAIDEAEKPELEARGDHELLWTMGDTADAWHVECRHCGDWTAEGPEGVVNPLADEHARRCVSMPTSDVLRLCQSHRDIVAEWRKRKQMADQLAAEGYKGAKETAEAVVAGLFAAVVLLARGYGVEET